VVPAGTLSWRVGLCQYIPGIFITILPEIDILWVTHRRCMPDKTEIWQGTLALMILKTLQSMGPLHGYGIARRIEQISGNALSVNYGTLYPALLKLEQEGYVA